MADEGRVMWKMKYRRVKIWPVQLKGSSTGRPPIHVRRRAVATRDQNIICEAG